MNKRVVLDAQMRVMASGQAYCTTCKNDSFVDSICTIGRIVRVHTKSFYYCIFCMRVHEWKSSGTEFMKCVFAVPKTKTCLPLLCCFCSVKSNTVASTPILDDELEVIQHVALCHRHMPQDHVLRWVDNVE